MAAILKNRLPVKSEIIRNGAIEFLDSENGGLAVGMVLLSSDVARGRGEHPPRAPEGGAFGAPEIFF